MTDSIHSAHGKGKRALERWILTACLSLWMGVAGAADNLQISNAWIREAPPGAPTLAGYLCLNNTSDTPVTLIGVDSPAFDHVMMHLTKTVDGLARMIHQDKVVIAAETRVCFEPGGLHLMISAPEHRLVAGDQVKLSLRFANGSHLHIQAPVKAP